MAEIFQFTPRPKPPTISRNRNTYQKRYGLSDEEWDTIFGANVIDNLTEVEVINKITSALREPDIAVAGKNIIFGHYPLVFAVEIFSGGKYLLALIAQELGITLTELQAALNTEHILSTEQLRKMEELVRTKDW